MDYVSGVKITKGKDVYIIEKDKATVKELKEVLRKMFNKKNFRGWKIEVILKK